MVPPRLCLGAVLALATACSTERGAGLEGAARPSFELACDSSDTASATTLFCVRTDTRTGDVQRVDHMALPTSSGSTATAASPPGRYTTVCDATSSDTRSDFYCVRLDTQTGEMLLVNLQKIGILPAREK